MYHRSTDYDNLYSEYSILAKSAVVCTLPLTVPVVLLSARFNAVISDSVSTVSLIEIFTFPSLAVTAVKAL